MHASPDAAVVRRDYPSRVKNFLCMTIIVVVGLCRAPSASAQTPHPQAGTTSMPILSLGLGPVGGALSEGLTAWPGGTDATFWNPAAAAAVRQTGGASLQFAAARLFEEMRVTSLSWDTPAGPLGISAQLLYAGVGDIPVRTGPSTDPIATTSANDVVLGLSAGMEVAGRGAVGITVKGLYEKLDTSDAFGAALDAGLQMPLPLWGGRVQAGLAVRNVGRTSRLGTESLTLPWSVAAGLALSRPIPIGEWRLLGAFDVWRPVDDWTQLRGGIEAVYDVLHLRLGGRTGKDRRALSAGLGLRMQGWRLDYSYTYDTDPDRRFLGNLQRLGVTLDLSGTGGRDWPR